MKIMGSNILAAEDMKACWWNQLTLCSMQISQKCWACRNVLFEWELPQKFFFSGEDYADEEFSVRERICRGFARNLYLNILILCWCFSVYFPYLCKVFEGNYVKWWKEMNIEWNMQTVRRRGRFGGNLQLSLN